MKQHRSWLDEECLGFLDQRKQTKMQWLQDPSQSNLDALKIQDVNLEDISVTKRRNILNLKSIDLTLTVGIKISDTCTVASVTLRRVTSLELI